MRNLIVVTIIFFNNLNNYAIIISKKLMHLYYHKLEKKISYILYKYLKMKKVQNFIIL